MFLWNRFDSDARVKREASALSENGYDVKVICAYDNNQIYKSKEEIINGYKIKRILTLQCFFLKVIYKLRNLIANKKVINKFIFNILFYLCLLVYKVLLNIGILKLLDAIIIIAGMIKEGISEEFDIYHCNDLKTLFQGVVSSKILNKKKIIYDSHEVETGRTGHKNKFKYFIENMLIRKADKVLMTTDMRADYNAKLYNIKKPEVIHNYPVTVEKDLSKFDFYKIADIPRSEPIFLYQGGIQPNRGLEEIIKSITNFNKGITVFIGDGKCKKNLQAMVKQMQIEDKVRFLPKVPNEELPYYTQYAYLGFQVLQNTCFNHYSTLSNKLFEYIMMEVPIIASDFPEIKKIVLNEEIGTCIESCNPKSIANAVNFFLDNNEVYLRYKNNCRLARLKYNWEYEKDKFVKIYDDT